MITKPRMAALPQSPESDSDDMDQIPWKITPSIRNTNAGYALEKKDRSWFVTSDIPPDLSIQVEDITFHVHKYALLSKSGYIGRSDLRSTGSGLGTDMKIDRFPGGPATFEVVLKFCYGLAIDLGPHNVAALRCASEFLEMTEDFEDGNLISKTEAFLTYIALALWADSIIVLKTCENLSPWTENLQIVRRCCDSISWKAFQDNTLGEVNRNESWWFDDVATLRIDHFIRIISALKAKGTRPNILGSCIMHYAEKWLPSMDVEAQGRGGHWSGKNELHLSIISGRNREGNISQNKEQKLIIESLISVLPLQREAVPCKFLLWLLKMSMIYSVTPALISEVEKRTGSVLKDATVQDLLIPSYGIVDKEQLVSSSGERTVYNIDTIHRILEYFLMYEQQQQQQTSEKIDVSKLLDNYLAEIAKDPNLTVTRFQVLAEALPDNSRICHDGLYRAIDTYLKTHPLLPEHDRKRLCRIMNCQKLSPDACMHIAQNDRLPLKTVVQVLFSEQLKMRTAMQDKEQAIGVDSGEDGEGWSSAKREIKNLKMELDQVKEKMLELKGDYTELQREYEKLVDKQKSTSTWTLRWRKIRKAPLLTGKVEDKGIGGKDGPNQGGITDHRRRQSIS